MNMLKETLDLIKAQDEKAVKEAWERLDNLTKPIGSLGKLEEIAAKMAGITGRIHNKIEKKNIIVMCGDNGITEEGVSACPQSLTSLLAKNMARGIMGVSVLAAHANSEVTVVDIGINDDFNIPHIIDKKLMHGTNNMAKEPAMTRDQAIKAIETGIEVVDELVSKGFNLFGTGELGIGNTATSAAVLSVLADMDSDMIVGKGSGLTDEQYNMKKSAIKRAIEVNKPDKEDAIDVIAKVGGLDIAGLCGCFLGAAKNRVPIVIDGFISSAAALCAYRLNPLTKDYMFPSHLSAEPGAKMMMDELGLEPMLNMNMRLGEGSGCPLAFNIVESALEIMDKMGTFNDALIVNDFLVDIR